MSTIAIYDSGVGGLTIHREVQQQCPDFDYVFISDNQAFPYGTKPEAELIERVTKVVDRVLQHYAPDLLVVACNSASTLALESLRNQFDLPIVGVVPAIKPAAELSKSKVIAVLATPGTIERQYTGKLIQQHAADCAVHKLGSSRLVELAEAKLHGEAIAIDEIASILEPLHTLKALDVLVLACTHFPLLRNEIAQCIPERVQIIDSGAAIAKRVKYLSVDFERGQTESIACFTKALDNTPLLLELERAGFASIDVLSV